jgi:hypothetical protein
MCAKRSISLICKSWTSARIQYLPHAYWIPYPSYPYFIVPVIDYSPLQKHVTVQHKLPYHSTHRALCQFKTSHIHIIECDINTLFPSLPRSNRWLLCVILSNHNTNTLITLNTQSTVSIQNIPHSYYWTRNLTLFFHLCLGLTSDFFPLYCATTTLQHDFVSLFSLPTLYRMSL